MLAPMIASTLLAIEGILASPTKRAPRNVEIALRRLRAEASAIPDMPTDGAASSSARWAINTNELRRRILSDDPRDFLRWEVIRRTMFVGSERYIRTELDELRNDHAWQQRWKPALREDRMGSPPGYPGYRLTSANMIHHAYHVMRFERATGSSIADLDCVFEFGGGYGGMCRLFHRLGFRGRYIILDLPIFSALQRFYLACLGPTDSSQQADAPDMDVHCVREAGAVAPLLQGSSRLFFATWSFSEVPKHVRNLSHDAIARCTHFMLAYQDRFEDLVNASMPADLAAVAPSSTHWQCEAMRHLPGSNYMIGCPAPRS